MEATKTAIQYFEAASIKDDKFVLPVASLAACYTFLGGSGSMNVAQAFSQAKEYAQKSNSLDNTLAETHLALATSSFWCDWNFENCGNSI